MQNLSSVCTCGDRLRVHRADIESCEICECEKFKAETDLEKLRAAFNGSHMGADRAAVFGDYQHDANLYAVALEHRLAQVTAVAQINIEAGRECKGELEKLQIRCKGLENAATHWRDTAKKAEQERDSATEQAKLGWDRAAEKDKAYQKVLDERDAAQTAREEAINERDLLSRSKNATYDSFKIANDQIRSLKIQIKAIMETGKDEVK